MRYLPDAQGSAGHQCDSAAEIVDLFLGADYGLEYGLHCRLYYFVSLRGSLENWVSASHTAGYYTVVI